MLTPKGSCGSKIYKNHTNIQPTAKYTVYGRIYGAAPNIQLAGKYTGDDRSCAYPKNGHLFFGPVAHIWGALLGAFGRHRCVAWPRRGSQPPQAASTSCATPGPGVGPHGSRKTCYYNIPKYTGVTGGHRKMCVPVQNATQTPCTLRG